MNTGFPSYMTEELLILDQNTRVVFLTEEEGLIDNYIRYRVTHAHSPHHQVFWIERKIKKFFLELMTHRSFNR